MISNSKWVLTLVFDVVCPLFHSHFLIPKHSRPVNLNNERNSESIKKLISGGGNTKDIICNVDN